MADIGTNPIILWDTLKLSANPLWARGDVLVVAHVKVQRRGQEGPEEYRVNFELNRHHGLVSHDVEVWIRPTGGDVPFWRYSGRRDIVVAIKTIPHNTIIRIRGGATRLDSYFRCFAD